MSAVGSRSRRYATALVMAVAASIVAAGCTPDTVPSAPSPRAIVNPGTAPAGTFVNVAAPDNTCRTTPSGGVSPYSSLQAAITARSTGVVIAQGYQFIGTSPSEYTAPDLFVRVKLPPALRPGVYNVLLSCFGYLDSFMYEPAQLTVTSGL